MLINQNILIVELILMMFKEYLKKQIRHHQIGIMYNQDGQQNKIKSDLLDKKLILLIIHNIKVIKHQDQAHIVFLIKYQNHQNNLNLHRINH
jgi:hypothetical protein